MKHLFAPGAIERHTRPLLGTPAHRRNAASCCAGCNWP